MGAREQFVGLKRYAKPTMDLRSQVLDKNTCKVVAAEYGLLVVDKEEEVATDKVSCTDHNCAGVSCCRVSRGLLIQLEHSTDWFCSFCSL